MGNRKAGGVAPAELDNDAPDLKQVGEMIDGGFRRGKQVSVIQTISAISVNAAWDTNNGVAVGAGFSSGW